MDVAQKFVQRHGSLVSMTDRKGQTQVDQLENTGRRWTEHNVRKLWGLLYGDQAKLVKFLVERDGTKTYKEVSKHMGYDAQHLSGILSPITRNAQTATGDRLARLIDWRLRSDGAREYCLDKDALPFFKRVLSQP